MQSSTLRPLTELLMGLSNVMVAAPLEVTCTEAIPRPGLTPRLEPVVTDSKV